MDTMTNNRCRSVFQNGRSEPVREHFTKVWISMINGIEHSKTTVVTKK